MATMLPTSLFAIGQAIEGRVVTLADVSNQLADFPADRVIVSPLPGTATEDDVVYFDRHLSSICELYHGTLVRKTMVTFESFLAVQLALLLQARLKPHGLVCGEAGFVRLAQGQVRAPDVAFYRWDRLQGLTPDVPILSVAPDLAIEILSTGNTAAEMDRKLREYFAAGVRLVWYIEPRTKTATVYRSADDFTVIDEHGLLTGESVLPEFSLQLAELFASLQPPTVSGE